MFRATRMLSRVLYAEAAEAVEGIQSDKMKLHLKLAAPHETFVDQEVDMVTLNTADGTTGIRARHIPILAQLAPGLLSFTVEGGAETQYFVPGGFATVDNNSNLGITVSDAFKLEDINESYVNDQISELNASVTGESDPTKKAEIEIGLSVYKAMQYALSKKV